MKLIFSLTISIVLVNARNGFGPTDQKWGFVTVRNNAHMFWWLHQTANPNVQNYTEVPLIIWLPGVSSSGFGNFAEIGPLDADLNPRNSTWVKNYNVLFVDNPVGAGYSYVDDLKDLPKNNAQIANDFLVLLQKLFETIPELKRTPFYIFGESYGGKMTTEIALVVDQGIKTGVLEANFIGIGLGDPWVSSIDSVMNWAPYLFNIGLIDQNGYEQILAKTQEIKDAFDDEDFGRAYMLWQLSSPIVEELTGNVSFYNVLYKVHKTAKFTDEQDDQIFALMNNNVREALGINVSWGNQSALVFEALSNDFMKPVTHIIERLLDTTNITIAIYNGQLDLIVNMPGTMKWVDSLNFNGSDDWKATPRNAFYVDNIVEGFHKTSGQLTFYWINRAGHLATVDNPKSMEFVLQNQINNE